LETNHAWDSTGAEEPNVSPQGHGRALAGQEAYDGIEAARAQLASEQVRGAHAAMERLFKLVGNELVDERRAFEDLARGDYACLAYVVEHGNVGVAAEVGAHGAEGRNENDGVAEGADLVDQDVHCVLCSAWDRLAGDTV
jgi:hypothetical protein